MACNDIAQEIYCLTQWVKLHSPHTSSTAIPTVDIIIVTISGGFRGGRLPPPPVRKTIEEKREKKRVE